MLKMRKPLNSYFWLLILVTLTLTGFGLVILGWDYRQSWGQTIWHICQSGVQNLSQHLAVAWQLVILVIASLAISRGGRSIWQQVQETQHFARRLLPFRSTPPVRLQTVLETHHLSAKEVAYLGLAAPRAFCLGFWRPRIWLTAGLVDLLTDEELIAVLTHEVAHCRQRDPLRLLLSRALTSAFFFLPLVSDLAKLAELQQEVAADQAAIIHLSNDLPLLCALQKLLMPQAHPRVPYSPFNVTEARLRRLIYPGQLTPFGWREVLASWAVNLSVILLLGSIGFLSLQPGVEHNKNNEAGACIIEEIVNPWQTRLSLLNW